MRREFLGVKQFQNRHTALARRTGTTDGEKGSCRDVCACVYTVDQSRRLRSSAFDILAGGSFVRLFLLVASFDGWMVFVCLMVDGRLWYDEACYIGLVT